MELVAAADLVPGKAEKFCKTNKLEGVRCYESGHAMLEAEDLDAVSICTYNCQHAPCAIDALEHGVHVMLEKPFTVTVDEAVEVMRAEKKSGKILTIGFQPRMSVNMKRIKQIVDSGELGKIYYIRRRPPGRHPHPLRHHLHRQGDRRHRRNGRHRLLLPGHAAERRGLSQAPDCHRLYL